MLLKRYRYRREKDRVLTIDDWENSSGFYRRRRKADGEGRRRSPADRAWQTGLGAPDVGECRNGESSAGSADYNRLVIRFYSEYLLEKIIQNIFDTFPRAKFIS